jgi:hypothetical protein
VNDAERSRLDRLLARGRLSQPEKERRLAALLRPASGRRRRWLWVTAAAPSLALAALLVWWPRGDGFRAKGDGGGPSVSASCTGGGCAVGATLVYRIEGAREPLYLAAWTVGEGGARTWHFPSVSGELPRVDAAGTPVLLPRGVRLGAPGAQTLHWMLVRRPLTRPELLAATGRDVAARGDQQLVVAP